MADEQRFDNAIRDVVAAAPLALCRWLLGTDAEAVAWRGSRLPSVPIEADSVFLVGDAMLLHVEFELMANPARIHPRLVDYWARLHRLEGVAPVQHVVVLAPARRLSGVFSLGGLELRYAVHHLWDIPAEELLRHDGLAPFAVLARPPDGADRIDLVGMVAEHIRRRETGRHRQELARHAATLANVHIGRSTLEAIFRRWTDMAVDLRELPMVREAMEEGRAEGRTAGRAEGRAEGKVEGQTEILCRILGARLGELGDTHRSAVLALDEAGRNDLADRLFELTSLDELADWLAAR